MNCVTSVNKVPLVWSVPGEVIHFLRDIQIDMPKICYTEMSDYSGFAIISAEILRDHILCNSDFRSVRQDGL